MRQAELKVRAAGRAGSRAAVELGPVGGRQDGDRASAAGPELDEALREAGEWERFKSLTGQIETTNEAICDTRPPLAQPDSAAPDREGQRQSCRPWVQAGRDLKFRGSLARERDRALHYFDVNATACTTPGTGPSACSSSGVVEAGCRSVIGQRLKLSGMRWTETGATGILTLRCHEASNRWDQIWQPSGQSRAA